MPSRIKVDLFKHLFSNSLLKYKNGVFNLIDFNKNLWSVVEQVKLFEMTSKLNNCLKNKIVFCFSNDDLKHVAGFLKKKIFKRYKTNIIISNFETIFKEDLKKVKLVICLGKTDRTLHEKCIQKKILFVSVMSSEMGQCYAHQMPVNVDSINKIVWLMLFIKKIYVSYNNRIKIENLKNEKLLKLKKKNVSKEKKVKTSKIKSKNTKHETKKINSRISV